MNKIICGDALEGLRILPDGIVQTCVTSPPYYGLRDYGVSGQIGLEQTPEEYVKKLVDVFREVRRVLKDNGTLWLNIGDSYNGSGGAGGDYSAGGLKEGQPKYPGRTVAGLKPKDLIGIPWMLAFALRADGWYLRSEIIWHKPNPMPESVTDRPTKAHEQIFLLAKSARYFYDSAAIYELDALRFDRRTMGGNQGKAGEQVRYLRGEKAIDERSYSSTSKGGAIYGGQHSGSLSELQQQEERQIKTRNKRSVWTVTTKPYKEAHFATFPPDLILPCILSGTSAKGQCAKCGKPWIRNITREANYEKRQDRSQPNGVMAQVDSTGWKPATVIDNGWQPSCDCEAELTPQIVLDPFAGSGTTLAVAQERGRDFIGIELNPEYVKLIHKRLAAAPVPLMEV